MKTQDKYYICPEWDADKKQKVANSFLLDMFNEQWFIDGIAQARENKKSYEMGEAS